MALSKQTFYVTTPIYYVNARPHLGSLYTTVLADVAARWHRIQGQETFFLTGTDEHGQKVGEAAAQAGMEPKAFVDGLSAVFREVFARYDCSFDRFIRTTDEFHVEGVQHWLTQLLETGDIYKGTYEGWYCPAQEAFLTEKDLTFVAEGEPPIATASGKPARWVSEECYFFRLSAYRDRLLEFYRQHPDFITPAERLNEVVTFVEAGLRDLSISRTTISWGIPFPGDEKHVVYVWADALNNYITAIGYGDPARKAELAKWWPADLQLMGKEIVRFHAVYWPAFLMATGLETPKRLLVHGWITVDGQKMSKSLGNVIDPNVLADTYGTDAIRFYLTRYLAITQDGDFSRAEFEQRLNSDLADSLGNLLNRMLALADRAGLRQVPVPANWGAREEQLREEAKARLAAFTVEMDRGYFHLAYAELWGLIAATNRYFHDSEPWKVLKVNLEHFAQIVAATSHALYAIAVMLWPVMPRSAEKLAQALGMRLVAGQDAVSWIAAGAWDMQFSLSLIPPLFAKYEAERKGPEAQPRVEQPAPAAQPSISIDELMRVETAVGTILTVEDMPKSEKIYKMTVDGGSYGIRQICAGVKKFYRPEELIGKKAVFVFNLQPRMMMGVESQGMMLTAKDADGRPTLVQVGEQVPNGTRLA
ncbi:MAG: methionine--tRNA ligase [Candidatus Dependentiae bacterium]|nr:methionine--tRNA ligase [Candidatus Dependentiae bacterium]